MHDCFSLQPVRSVSVRTAAEEIAVAASNGASSSAPSNMLDFEELSDIVRSVRLINACDSLGRHNQHQAPTARVAKRH